MDCFNFIFIQSQKIKIKYITQKLKTITPTLRGKYKRQNLFLKYKGVMYKWLWQKVFYSYFPDCFCCDSVVLLQSVSDDPVELSDEEESVSFLLCFFLCFFSFSLFSFFPFFLWLLCFFFFLLTSSSSSLDE